MNTYRVMFSGADDAVVDVLAPLGRPHAQAVHRQAQATVDG